MFYALAILLALAWIWGLWWAVRALGLTGGKRAAPEDESRAPVTAPVARAWPVLFVLAHALLLSGVGVRLVYGALLFNPLGLVLVVVGETLLLCLLFKCGTETIVEPRLIGLSVQHHLRTAPEYERVVLWRPAHWLFEKPLLTGLAVAISLGSYAGGGLLRDPGYHYLAAFGLNLLLSLWVTFRFSTLTVRPSRVTRHRWLSFRPVRELATEAIVSVEVDRSLLQRLMGVGRLCIRATDGRGLKVVLGRAPQIARLIDRLRARPPASPRSP